MKHLTLYRPMDFDCALEDFDRYLGSFFSDTPFNPSARNIPAVDIKETDDAYHLEMELPGYDEKSVELRLDGNKLTVSSGKEDSKEEKKENFLIRERGVTGFSRTFTMPEDADGENVSAVFKNGLLRVEIKKEAESSKKRLIEIKAS